MSLTNLAVLEAAALDAKSLGLDTAVFKYVNATSATQVAKYDEMYILAKQVKSNMPTDNGKLPRITITGADGVVLVDTNKNDATNVQGNAKEPTNPATTVINTNHNSRLAILTAALGSSGIGMEKKKSSSTGRIEEYYAERVGISAQNAIGVIRYSC